MQEEFVSTWNTWEINWDIKSVLHAGQNSLAWLRPQSTGPACEQAWPLRCASVSPSAAVEGAPEQAAGPGPGALCPHRGLVSSHFPVLLSPGQLHPAPLCLHPLRELHLQAGGCLQGPHEATFPIDAVMLVFLGAWREVVIPLWLGGGS